MNKILFFLDYEIRRLIKGIGNDFVSGYRRLIDDQTIIWVFTIFGVLMFIVERYYLFIFSIGIEIVVYFSVRYKLGDWRKQYERRLKKEVEKMEI